MTRYGNDPEALGADRIQSGGYHGGIHMSQLRTVGLAWVKLGTIPWEDWRAWGDWWVKPPGTVLEQMPGLKEHVSVANFDLQRSGCPIIIFFGDDPLEIRGVSDSKLEEVKQIVENHGFRITSVS